MLRNVPLKNIKDPTKKMSLFSKEDRCSSDESDGEEKEAREVIFITQETHNDEHRNIDIDETDSEG